MYRLPLIGVAICSRQIGLHAYHISGDTGAHAVASAAPGFPAILPMLMDDVSLSDILDRRDDTPITVTSFNIEPIPNSGSAMAQGTARDSARLAFAARFEKHDSLS
jgi:hypothetical protein